MLTVLELSTLIPIGQLLFATFWLQTMSLTVLLAIVTFAGKAFVFTMMPRAPLLPVGVVFVFTTVWIRFPDSVRPVTVLPTKMPLIEPVPPAAALEVTLVIVLFATAPPVTSWFR